MGETKLFSGVAGIFKGIGKTVSTVIGTTGGTGVAGTIAAAVSHIPVIGKILLGGTLAVGAIGGGSLTTGIKRIGAGITKVVKGIGSTISKAVKGVGSFISKLMPWNWGKSSSDSGSKRRVSVLGKSGLGTGAVPRVTSISTKQLRTMLTKRAKR